MRARHLLAAAVLAAAAAAPAAAARLEVGSQQPLKSPSAAAAVAHDGDTIVIDPGSYFDCAIWRANGLTITGAGTADSVVITDKTCEGKALFVIHGNDTIVRHLTFTRARVADGNGAGIRLAGHGLTIDDSRFINNQSGLLAGDGPGSTVVIRDSTFIDNGTCQPSCASPVQVGRIARLHIADSHFSATRQAHDIVSLARHTELVGDTIEDGAQGTASYLVDLPRGGTLTLDRNVLQKGPRTDNPRAAIMVGDGAELEPDTRIVATANHFADETGRQTAFILDWSGGDPVLAGNVFSGDVVPVSTRGVWLHRLRVAAAEARAGLHTVAAGTYHSVKAIATRLGLH